MDIKNNLSPEEIATLETYEKIAHLKAEFLSDVEFRKKEFETFQKYLPKGKIIDVGCGHGRDAILFTKANYDYVGIDLSDALLVEAKKLAPHANFIEMNMYSMDFKTHFFDGFWATASLLHIPKKKVKIILDEIKKVVKPEGIGFFAMKEGDGEKVIKSILTKNYDRFYAFYRHEEFSEIIQKNGFKILEHSRRKQQSIPIEKPTVWLLYFVKIQQ